ncbi:stage 0 sporulation protein J [Candidatus Kaiserbacteria bacterium CG10_big_fil_rev_8_21_14_0_10_43_70]|uniref:Stage 0 sporulation protein J n=1 Tax=Candidatus Kaiserbacteria bacterium CG10_big_fil_rev_8_21_14_0_10_43_70 TaxID=1974605 RepID=A0A2H0UJE3_9BACT|nr:MAG: stage 0 sporulation protein J [Candidatus Kaiserbacteria bacterium CG10_big_fil_rev_8_21_14_0_10_43_70]
MEGRYYTDSIFWIEVEKIKPNPYQPRKTFNESALASLAESIRQYGVLQPLVVTRKEIERPGEGLFVEYELISGERRLRASKIAGVSQVPVVIRSHEETDKMKLELAIIENLQREDLNPVDRAKAFQQLVNDFGLKHAEVGKRVGKSREFVSNTLRILALPEYMQEALAGGKISEGHTRPLLMLSDRKEEQAVLFKEVLDKNMTVREAERIARRIAVERARKKDLSPELMTMEKELTETLGTRVTIEKRENGGKLHIDFFSEEDLMNLLNTLRPREVSSAIQENLHTGEDNMKEVQTDMQEKQVDSSDPGTIIKEDEEKSVDDIDTEDLYSIKNFSV